ncbi:hypothetical protein HF313_21570 [Massilia atriviolacea]|uniref:2OG-Fe(II) oxygenase n=1 Tax=Massilia atriviolacea TaxID=2495579 RepID=A0A430HRI8_9BURK|nr:DUF6445 family protein [Massilia atriviolacea]RSZ60145.1 hypothetical protein EJB06_03120 [Massilia atriviolacea]
MFNPRPQMRYVAIPGHAPCVVVDDFLRDPHALVAQAVAAQAQFAVDPANYYPGPELDLGRDTSLRLDEFFIQHVRRALGAQRTVSVAARLALATLQPAELHPLQRLCHRDCAELAPGVGAAAAVVYLFDDARLGGTGFYRPTQGPEHTARVLRDAHAGRVSPGHADGYLSASNADFELLCAIPARFNRAIFYDGEIFHAAQIAAPALLHPDPARGRLTMNGFFRFRKRSA